MSGSNDQQRVTTLVKVVGSVARAIIGSIAAVIVLAAVGLNAAPLIAGAGIAGVAVGFGAQSIFKDFFAGFFILLNPVQFGNCISGVEVRAPQGAPSNA
jgi:small conductance mechanosensitive channel